MSFINSKENPLIGLINGLRTERRIGQLRRSGDTKYIQHLQRARALQVIGTGSDGRSTEDQVAALTREYQISDTLHAATNLAIEMVGHRLNHPGRVFIHKRINRLFFPDTNPANYHGEIFPDGKPK